MNTLAEVIMWGRTIGAVSLEAGAEYAAFQYTPEFAASGIEVSPITMPLSNQVYVFPQLPRQTFHGLPGLLADSLPDKYGNALINAWLASQGRTAEDFNVIERLSYVGSRGMGALEFAPLSGPVVRLTQKLEVDALVQLASDVLNRRSHLHTTLERGHREEAMKDILHVGTSAGGARAKAVIAWNRETNEVRSGQVDAGQGFEYWLLKFDGVAGNRDKELDDPRGYGAVEYAYALMAKDAGIAISECRLLEENGRRHFMTKRFDRTDDGGKLHAQTLGALAHFDYNNPGAYAYEQALLIIRQLGLPMATIEQQFRRMAFNIVARNQDDHVKNIGFVMNQQGEWSLSPAYDITYSYNPEGEWTGKHQMSMNGKRDGFTLDDFRACAKSAMMKRGRAETIVKEMTEVVANWREYADKAGVTPSWRDQIFRTYRLDIADAAAVKRARPA